METASQVKMLQFSDLIAGNLLWLFIRGDLIDEKSLVSSDRCKKRQRFMPSNGNDFALVARTAFIFTA